VIAALPVCATEKGGGNAWPQGKRTLMLWARQSLVSVDAAEKRKRAEPGVF